MLIALYRLYIIEQPMAANHIYDCKHCLLNSLPLYYKLCTTMYMHGLAKNCPIKTISDHTDFEISSNGTLYRRRLKLALFVYAILFRFVKN